MAQRNSSLLTTGEAAKLCEVTPDTILKWIRKGRLRGVRTAGGHYRISLRDLEPHVCSDRLEDPPEGMLLSAPRRLYCWEYLGDKGVVREKCKNCVVYRVRAAECLEMADLGTEVGHARQFCGSSCEDCVYYRRVRGLPTNVLVITANEALVERLSTAESNGITLRLARTAYEASTIVQSFRAAFVVVDRELLVARENGLLDSLANDPRLPGVKIVLAVEQGTASAELDENNKDLVFSVIEKPFGTRRIAAVVNSFPIEQSIPWAPSIRVLTGKGASDDQGRVND